MAFDEKQYKREYYLRNREKIISKSAARYAKLRIEPRTDDRCCGKCGEFKANAAFDKNDTKCKECRRAGRRMRYAKDEVYRETLRRRSREYIAAHPGRTYFESHEYPERFLVYAARARAKKLKLPCTITEADIVIPERCPWLNIPLKKNNGKVSATSPTIDRLIPERGYVPGNVIVISHRANSIKNAATLDELKMIAAGLETALRSA